MSKSEDEFFRFFRRAQMMVFIISAVWLVIVVSVAFGVWAYVLRGS